MVDNTPPDNSSVINGKAIASLITGMLSILLPIIGIYFDVFLLAIPSSGIALGISSLVLYRKARKEMAWTGEGGRGLAIAGLNFSIVGIFIQFFLIYMYLALAPAFE